MSISVLLVDDEPVLLDLASTYLTQAAGDIVIDTVDSGSAALEKIRHCTFDAVVSDYEMPGMNGIELLKKLKADSSTAPFILFTGRGREEVAIEALNNGAAFYLQKGGEARAQFAELIHKIREAVRRDRAERAAKETSRRMADILNFLPDPVIAIDDAGKLIVWNRAMEELTGVLRGDLLGKGNYEYAVPFYGKRRPLLLDLVLHPDEQLLTDGYTIKKRDGNLLIGECQITLPDGKKRMLWVKATRLHDADGKVTGAIEILRDVTERKRIIEERKRARQKLQKKNEEIVQANERLAETEKDLRQKNEELGQAFEEITTVEEELRQTFSELQESHRSLRESEEDYRLLVESLTDAVVVHTDGRILYGNPAALSLFKSASYEHLMQGSLWSYFGNGCAEEMMAMSRQVLDEGCVIPHLGSRIMRPDGTVVPVEITLCPTRHRGIGAVLAVLRDSTERQKYEEEIRAQTRDLERQAKALAQANRTITLMSTVTRHDILNQISALRGYLSLGKLLATDNTKLLSYMERQEAAAESIYHHILFTRDYKEIGERDPEWQDVRETFSRAILRSGASRVRFEIDATGTEIYADHMLEKVFYNLIDNSLRHGGHVTIIRISVSHREGSLILTYEDDGAGVPAAEKERIFRRGYGKNTGLGLFLAREILAITGIAIEENGEPGKGGRFTMTVPEGAYRCVKKETG
ncbi:MAG: aerobic respiration control sensor protein ArcB [Methanoregula sp. PtaU1.Bin051]|nr:MAG: aerobic respiration control sensor protein ArcB [Methanoregula sp. PtaU1.Bin051]